MNEEKEILENEIEEVTPEVTEEIIEETVSEDVEEIVEEAVADEVCEALEEVEAVVEKAEFSKSAVAVISAAITFAVCVIIVGVLYFTTYNTYNANKDGYISTIAEIAELNEMTLDEFKAEWGLPSGMPGSTTEAAAQSYISTSKFVEMSYGMNFEQFAQIVGIKEEDGIDGNSPWGKTQKFMMEKSKAAAEEAPESENAEGEQAPAENAEGEQAPAENAEGEAAEQEPVHPDDAAAAE